MKLQNRHYSLFADGLPVQTWLNYDLASLCQKCIYDGQPTQQDCHILVEEIISIFAYLWCVILVFREMKKLLHRCAETALSSKLVARHKEFFGKMVCEAVMHLDELLPLNMIGVKKVKGGALEVGLDLNNPYLV